MEVPDDVYIEIMLLLDDKSLRRVATISKQTKRIYDSDYFIKLNNKDVDFDRKTHKKILLGWECDKINSYYFGYHCALKLCLSQLGRYVDNYILPPRELHDHDQYIYRDVTITKEELDQEIEDYYFLKKQ